MVANTSLDLSFDLSLVTNTSRDLNTDLWLVQDFVGGDLRVRDNPRRVAGAEQCQQECADTPGCQVRTFYPR